VADYLDIGNTTGGSLNLKNPGTTLTTNTESTSYLDWGLGGGTASVALSDHATANIQASHINIAADSTSIGLVTIESGADLTTNGLYVASAGGLGQVDVRGAGSTLTQNSGSTLTIGSASGLVGLLNVHANGVFTSGTGVIELNPTGQIRVNDATLNANGNLTVASTGAGLGGVLLENQGQINSRDVFIGTNAANGSMLINGYTPMIGLPATWNVTGSMMIGSSYSFGGSSAIVEQSGRLQVSNDVIVGTVFDEGHGSLTVQTDGQVTIGGTLSFGQGSEVILLGGEINTRSFSISPLYFPQTPGKFTHEDGTLTVDGGSFYIGTGGLYIDSDTGTGMPTIKLENHATGSVRASPDFSDGFIDIGWHGQGRLEILSGSLLTSNEGSIASSGQNFPNSNGHVLVQGKDSLWQIRGNDFGTSWLYSLVVGQTGAGTLEIRAGGHVVSEGHVVIGSPGAGSGRGTAIVDGPDSLLWVTADDFGAAAQLSVGVLSPSAARGALTVSNSGRVEVDGELIVEDAGSVTLTSGGEIHTGSFVVHSPGTFTHDDGTLTVDGGTFDPGILNYSLDGNVPSDRPTMKLLNGAMFNLPTGGQLIVGDDYHADLEIHGGSTVTASLVNIGNQDTSTLGSNLLVEGGNSTLTITYPDHGLSALTVGSHGKGSLSISAGGKVALVDPVLWTVVGADAGSEGVITVDGKESELQTQNVIAIGNEGNGKMYILNGGLVYQTGIYLPQAGHIGSGGEGYAEVRGIQDGIRSRWIANGSIRLGIESKGILHILDGAYVQSQTGELAPYPGPDNIGEVLVQGTGPGGVASHWNLQSYNLYVGGRQEGPGSAGALTVANGGLVTAGSVTVWQPGTVELNGGIVSTNGDLELSGGTLRGDGSAIVGVQLINDGVVAPGFLAPDSPIGVINVAGGNYVQGSGGILAIDIGGTSAFERDQLNVATGSALLGGVLHVALVSDYMPAANTAFEILSAAGGLLGHFDEEQFLAPDLAGKYWQVDDSSGSSVVLRVLALTVTGDYNGDGTVNAADYTVWRNKLGKNLILPNEDPLQTPGQVTREDFFVWKTHYGETSPGSGAANVPEPTSWVLAGVAAALGICYPRRRLVF
jgi:T5SS/PEP-CTERM-associated repeat protein